MAHLHPVYDTDPHFIIDPDSRQITYADSKPVVLIQNDHKSEHFTFELPREIDGHDMAVCDLVQVHYINIGGNFRNPGLYEVVDLQIAEDDDNVVICSWEITQNATSLSGSLSFMLRFACTTDGEIDYAWNTAIFSGIVISPGIDNSGAIATEYADVLAQWYDEITNLRQATLAAQEQLSVAQEQIGDIDEALGSIIAIQESLIGGDA